MPRPCPLCRREIPDEWRFCFPCQQVVNAIKECQRCGSAVLPGESCAGCELEASAAEKGMNDHG